MQVGFSKSWSPTSVIPGSIGLILPWSDLFSLDSLVHSSINQMDFGWRDLFEESLQHDDRRSLSGSSLQMTFFVSLLFKRESQYRKSLRTSHWLRVERNS